MGGTIRQPQHGPCPAPPADALPTRRYHGRRRRAIDPANGPGAPGEIDIHAGDAIRLLDGAGRLVESAWRWGCSHSWAINLAFQDGRFAAACHGDAYPNAFHVDVFEPGRHLGDAVLHEGLDPTQRALGGLAPTEGGVWILHMARAEGAMALHLARIDDAGVVTRDAAIAEATDLPTAYPFRAHLAAYDGDRMLAGWSSGDALQLAVLDRASGALVEGPVPARSPGGAAAVTRNRSGSFAAERGLTGASTGTPPGRPTPRRPGPRTPPAA